MALSNQTLFGSSLVFLFALTFTLFAPVQVYAESLTLPQEFQYDGLTFSEPLTFSSSKQTPASQMTLHFFTAPDMLLKPEKKQLILIPTTIPDLITQTPTPTQIDTPTIKPTDTNTPTPTTVPTATPTVIQPTVTASRQPSPPETPTNQGGLNADKLFSMVNNYRTSKGLSAFQRDDRTCQLAASRAPEINNEIATGTMHSGLHARNLPYWNTENIISMNSEEAAFNWWLNDSIHKAAIESNNTYSCMACSGNACVEEFTNYQPK